MWIVLGFSSGDTFISVVLHRKGLIGFGGLGRTNKAQYSDVSLQSVEEGDVAVMSLPSMQGEDESEGPYLPC